MNANRHDNRAAHHSGDNKVGHPKVKRKNAVQQKCKVGKVVNLILWAKRLEISIERELKVD